MKIHIAFILILYSICLPITAKADFVVPHPTGIPFENLQNLILTAAIVPNSDASSTNPTPLTEQGTYTNVPTNTPFTLSYTIDHSETWPQTNAAPDIRDLLFARTLAENKLYLELWEGTPFTGAAHMIQNWDISNAPTGQVSASIPENGNYFLVAYFPDGFYQDPEAECPDDAHWQEDCAPSYTIDQVRSFFSSSATDTSADTTAYEPDAYGGIIFTIATPSPDTSAIASNVLFIPGTLTSRLYMKNSDGSERELWEPRSDLDIPFLAMNADGTSKYLVYTRDIMTQLYSNDSFYHQALHVALKKDTDVYGSFESYLDSLVADHTIKEWRGYPYDWRYDVRDIVSDGTLIGTATTSPSRVYLQDVVQELASTSATGKVTIVAHSNGGLIAKALAIDLAKKNELGLIDRIIMIGTPQFGTPKSVTDLLHGDEFTQLGGLIMYSDTVRDTEATMPGAYDLIPSPAYFSHVKDAVAAFDTNAPADEFRKAIGALVNSFSQLSDFLSDAFHLDGGAGLEGSTKTPIPLSENLIEKAAATHDALDAWTPPNGLAVIAIAGWGNLTPYQETYTGTSGLNCDRTSFFVPFACSLLPQLQPGELYSENGDDTVVAASAIGDVENAFYLNVKKLFSDTSTKIVHSSLLAAAPIQASVKDILTDTPIDSPYMSTSTPTNAQTPLIVVSAHSPVNILATDAAGNETGTVPVPELPGIYFQKEDIPGSSIEVVGEEKYLYVPEGVPFQILATGYDTGTTTIDIGSMDSDGSTTITHIYPDIPTTASTTATFSVAADDSVISAIPELQEDSFPTATTTDATTTLAESGTTTSKSIPIYVSGKVPEKISEPKSTTFKDSVSLVRFFDQRLEPVTHLPEIIRAIITIKTKGNSWVMYSTIFISLLRTLP